MFPKSLGSSNFEVRMLLKIKNQNINYKQENTSKKGHFYFLSQQFPLSLTLDKRNHLHMNKDNDKYCETFSNRKKLQTHNKYLHN
jgi:hypothetical protein